MRILYIFPHPDDESFGPAHVMFNQRRQGHEVHLLTLTKGGATRQRFNYGYSVEEMGDVRFGEMRDMARVLDLSGLTVLDLPDSGLKEMDPRDIESRVSGEIERIRPQVVVTYPVHGISGFHDHLVTHAVVKRVFCKLREKEYHPRRLAFFTITGEDAKLSKLFPLSGSKPEEIDCVLAVDDIDIGKAREALDCYTTFRETIERSGIKDMIGGKVSFELFGEKFDPPLSDLFDSLPPQD